MDVIGAQVGRLVFQKLVKDPHNRRITEGELKENRRVHDHGIRFWNVHGMFMEMFTEMFTEWSYICGAACMPGQVLCNTQKYMAVKTTR